jgi:hypothetical protein
MAYRAKAEHRLAEADDDFARARAAGADPQRVAMELGYLASERGEADDAQLHFQEALHGPDADIAEAAHRELAVGPRHLWADVYAEALGWAPTAGGHLLPATVVPTVRARAFWRPVLDLDLHLYAYAQATRDTASTAGVAVGIPVIYADDYGLFGAGVRFRLWEGRIGLFAQAGPAVDLLPGSKSPVLFDARAGFDLFAETPRCAPPPRHDVSAAFEPCAEVYAEVTYASRFDNNVFAFARPRAGFTYLMTGPVAWQLVGEVRVAKDINADYYNNFADAGGGPRFRLLSPFRLDLLATADGGTYFGLHGRDPAPHPLAYGAIRLEAATYLEY